MVNAYAAYGADLTIEDVMQSEPMFYPLNRLDVSLTADGSIVMVLASKRAAKKLTDIPVWIRGAGWNSDSSWLESREWGRAVYGELAANMAYKTAGIKNPSREIQFAEVDDLFSYKELQHLEALKLCRKGEAGKLTEEGVTQNNGEMPVNVSGGALGMGFAPEVLGLQRVLEMVLQMRGQAGRRQLCDAETGVAQSWRGIPTTTGAVAILSREAK